MRECGLKLYKNVLSSDIPKSLLMRECGLKHELQL